MTRTWKLLAWTGKEYRELMRFNANGPKQALKTAGLLDPMFSIVCSRRGYGYHTGRVEIRTPETIAAEVQRPLPADFQILVIDEYARIEEQPKQ